MLNQKIILTDLQIQSLWNNDQVQQVCIEIILKNYQRLPSNNIKFWKKPKTKHDLLFIWSKMQRFCPDVDTLFQYFFYMCSKISGAKTYLIKFMFQCPA